MVKNRAFGSLVFIAATAFSLAACGCKKDEPAVKTTSLEMPRDTQSVDYNFFVPLDFDGETSPTQHVDLTLKALDSFRKGHPTLIIQSVFEKDHGLYIVAECGCQTASE